MEHILQFAINIDDEAIKQRVEQSATDKLADDLKQKIESRMFKNPTWAGSGFAQDAEKVIRVFLEENKDKIIEQSVTMVVDSIKRSKKYRDALVDVVEELK